MSEPTLQVLTTEQRLDRYVQICNQKAQLLIEADELKERLKEVHSSVRDLDTELTDMTRLYTSGQQVLGVV